MTGLLDDVILGALAKRRNKNKKPTQLATAEARIYLVAATRKSGNKLVATFPADGLDKAIREAIQITRHNRCRTAIFASDKKSKLAEIKLGWFKVSVTKFYPGTQARVKASYNKKQLDQLATGLD